MSEQAEKYFKKWCNKKGIESVNEHTAFRWDEVIEFAEAYHKEQSKVDVLRNKKDEECKFCSCQRYDYCLGYNKALEDLESLPEPPKQ